jgi:DNA invertase Pin-like site-specific DNA recombinase
MAEGKFIAYYRVSTARQGDSRLGLEAQQKSVRDYLNGGNWELIQEITEVESGRKADRPQLAEALRLCRVYNATLIIARLDRLARNAHFLLGLQEAGVDFRAVDMPNATPVMVGMMALIAQDYAQSVSNNTKAALAASKAKGTKLGGMRERGLGTPEQRLVGQQRSILTRQRKAESFAADVSPFIIEMHKAEMSLRSIAADLNAKKIPTARGKAWTAMAVRRIVIPK